MCLMLCSTYWKSVAKTPEERDVTKWRRSDIFIVNSAQIQYNIRHIGLLLAPNNKFSCW